MERRKRVEMIMNSRMFREELERIIEVQMRDGGTGPAGLMQQIQDIIGASGAGRGGNLFRGKSFLLLVKGAYVRADVDVLRFELCDSDQRYSWRGRHGLRQGREDVAL